MTAEKFPAKGADPAVAPGPVVPEQVVRERVADREVMRPAVPEQATAPAQEAAAPVEEALAPAEEAGTGRPHRRLHRRRPRRQSAFRRWRKTRPFWGGILTMLGGLEIAAITGASYELLLISKSVGFAIAVGAAIAVLGLTMWLSPALSKLLGLMTFVVALLSFVTSNLGGFLLGMLLAILGGGLAFAWEPGRPAVEPEVPTEHVEMTDTDDTTEDVAGDAAPAGAAAQVPSQRADHGLSILEPADRAEG